MGTGSSKEGSSKENTKKDPFGGDFGSRSSGGVVHTNPENESYAGGTNLNYVSESDEEQQQPPSLADSPLKSNSNARAPGESQYRIDKLSTKDKQLFLNGEPISKWRFIIYKSSIYLIGAGLIGEVFYEVFTLRDSSQGMVTFLQNMFGFPSPFTEGKDGDNPDTLWSLPGFVGFALVLTLLDFGANLTTMEPVSDAKKFSRIKQLETGKFVTKYTIEKDEIGNLIAKNPERFKCDRNTFLLNLLPVLMASINFVNGASVDSISANAILEFFGAEGTVKDVFNWVLGLFLAVAGTAYYVFLSLDDVLTTVKELRKGSDSVFAKLWHRDRNAAFMALSKGGVTHSFRGAVFALITYQFFTEVLKAPAKVTAISTAVGALAGFLTSVFTRQLQPYKNYMQPFASHLVNGDPVDYLANKDLNSREQAWQKLEWCHRFQYRDDKKIWLPIPIGGKMRLVLPPLVLGLIRSGPLGYLVYNAIGYRGDGVFGMEAGNVAALIVSGLTTTFWTAFGGGELLWPYIGRCLGNNPALPQSRTRKFLQHTISYGVSTTIAAGILYPLYLFVNTIYADEEKRQYMQCGLTGVWSLSVFLHAFITDFIHGKDMKGYELRKENGRVQVEKDEPDDNDIKVGKPAKVIAFWDNLGSQSARFFVGLAAQRVLTKYTGLSPEYATMLLFLIGSEVGWTNFLYFRPKLEEPTQIFINRLKKIPGMFSTCFKNSGYHPISDSEAAPRDDADVSDDDRHFYDQPRVVHSDDSTETEYDNGIGIGIGEHEDDSSIIFVDDVDGYNYDDNHDTNMTLT